MEPNFTNYRRLLDEMPQRAGLIRDEVPRPIE